MNESKMVSSRLGDYVSNSMGEGSFISGERNSFISPSRRNIKRGRDSGYEFESLGSIHLKNPNESPSKDDIIFRDGNPLEDSLYESSIAIEDQDGANNTSAYIIKSL